MILKIKVSDYIRKCSDEDLAWTLLGCAGIDKEQAKQKHEAMVKFLKTEIAVDTEKGEVVNGNG